MYAEHWAKLRNGKTVPVCLSLSCGYSDIPGTSYHVNFKRPNYPDVKLCMKLLKNGYKFYQNNSVTKNPKDDLIAFLFYKILFYFPNQEQEKNIKETKYFEFKKNQHSMKISETFYLSDEVGIALINVKRSKIKCCYLSTNTNEVVHRTVKYIFHHSVAKLSDNVLWLISWVDGSKISFMHITIDKEVKPVCGYYSLCFLPCNIKKAKNSIEALIMFISTSKTILFANLCKNYVNIVSNIYSHKDIPNCCGEVTRFYLVCDNIFVAKENIETGVPKIFIIKILGDMFTKSIIDLSQDLLEYKEFLPSSFEITASKTGLLLFLTAGEGYIVLIDLRLGSVFQILSYVNFFWSHFLSTKYSWKDDEIWLIGEHTEGGYLDYIYIRFKIWRGISLVNLSLNMIFKYLPNYPVKIPKHLQHFFL